MSVHTPLTDGELSPHWRDLERVYTSKECVHPCPFSILGRGTPFYICLLLTRVPIPVLYGYLGSRRWLCFGPRRQWHLLHPLKGLVLGVSMFRLKTTVPPVHLPLDSLQESGFAPDLFFCFVLEKGIGVRVGKGWHSNPPSFFVFFSHNDHVLIILSLSVWGCEDCAHTS